MKDNQTVLSMVAGKLGITIMRDLDLPEKPERIKILPLLSGDWIGQEILQRPFTRRKRIFKNRPRPFHR
jgi:hypothetical protein